MAYTKETTAKIVRTTHKVDFYLGITQLDLMNMLKHVPPGARAVEVEGGDSSDDKCEITFQTEESNN